MDALTDRSYASPGPQGEPFTAYVWGEGANQFRAMERLEAEITELWGHINAATYRFLALVAAYDRQQGWALHGLAGCAQWLSWQCGIGAVAAREKVRVARSLEGLPKIADSFRRGVISYSKVRAMTRIATPENEADLLNIAESGTALHVERVVSKYRRIERSEDAVRANELQRHRSLYVFYDEDGSVVIHAKLPPEVGALVRKAIEAALAEVENANRAETVEAEAVGTDAVETESNVSAETSGATGASRTRPTDETDEAAYEQAQPWSVRPQDTLAAKRADALRLIAESFLTRRTEALGSVADRFQVVVHIDQRALTHPVVRAEARAGAPGAVAGATGTPGLARCSIDDDRALPIETARRLGCDASLVGIVEDPSGMPLSVGRKTRSIPPALARALEARDGGCRFPGCGRTRFTEGHHVRHWADGGETKLSNLITLCRFHHRLIHEGGFGVHVLDDGSARSSFVFTRPDGTRIEANGRPCFRGNISRGASGEARVPKLFALNREAGVAINWRTARCGWRGERMDYGLALQALMQRRI